MNKFSVLIAIEEQPDGWFHTVAYFDGKEKIRGKYETRAKAERNKLKIENALKQAGTVTRVTAPSGRA